ncbi:MAG: glycosyltransferase [Bacteroidales bacterium]|nr:glycosyltransferase [Bacteroidales bacterium]
MIVLGIIVSAVCLSYVSVVIYWLAGWYKTREHTYDGWAGKNTFSIIVAFYNEQAYIERCLESLVKVDYDKHKYEIIMVDDGSTDGSADIVQRIIQAYPQADITLLSREHAGKKPAVKAGVQAAKYELILTTDADCAVQPSWVKVYDSYYERYHKPMMFGSVLFFTQPRLFNYLQQLEIGSLMIAAAGCAGQGKVLMCSAANMCYTKNMYMSLQAHMEKSNKCASGDDVFLMHALAQQYGAEAAGYVRSRQSLVFTQARNTYKSFIRQRIRWAGKTPYYDNTYVKNMAVIVGAMSVLPVVLLLSACFQTVPFALAGMAFFVKFAVDMPVLSAWCRYIAQPSLMWWYPLAALCYPWYVISVLAGMCCKKKRMETDW